MLLFAQTQLSIGDALLLSLVGIVLIMIVLILLMYVIKLMSFVLTGSREKKQEQPDQPQEDVISQAPSVTVSDEQTAPGSCGQLTLVNVSEKDAAIIMAIVADQMQTPLNQLRFGKIQLVEKESK